MKVDVFISYSTKNQAIADAVHRDLSDAGLHCWLAPRELKAGDLWAASIVEAIDASRLMVVVLSQDADRSPQVLREVNRAVHKWLAIIAVKIEVFALSREMEYYLGPVHWLDASKMSLDQCLSRLKGEAIQLLTATPSATTPWALSLSPVDWVPADQPLIGRAAEKHVLEQVWNSAQAGTAQAVVVSGAAGEGKTRLVQEVVTKHRGDTVSLLFSRALPGAKAPYQAITQALKPVIDQNLILGLPEDAMVELRRLDSRAFPDAVPREAQERREWALTLLFEALSRRTQVVLFMDDLQWTDQASLDFVQYLLIRNQQTRLLFIGTLRTDDQDAMASPVLSLLTHLRRANLLTEIDLKPLSQEDSHALLCTSLGLTAAPLFHDKLFSFTEGNPYFLLETIRALSDQGVIYRDASGLPSTDYDEIGYHKLPVPHSIQQAIRLRLDALDPPALAFLDAAAVVGRQFDPYAVQQVAGLDDEAAISALDQIMQRQFVRENGELYDFSHGLIRETISAALNPLKRKSLHRRAFMVLSESIKPVPSLAEVQQLALHADNGGLWLEAFRYSLQAGLSTWELFDAPTALHYLERAQAAAHKLQIAIDPEDAVRLLLGLGDVCANLGRYDEARTHYQDAMLLAKDDERLIARLQWKMAITYQDQARLDDALIWLERSYALAQHGLDDILCAQVCMQYGIICVRRGNLPKALTWAERACVVDSAQYHNLMAVLQRSLDNLEQALRHCEQAIALAGRQRNLLDLAKAHTNRGAVLSQMNRWQEAKQAHEQASQVLSATRDMRMYTGAKCNLSDVCRHLGDLDTAIRLAEEALKLAEAYDLRFEQALAHLNVGEALMESGQPHRARTDHLVAALHILDELKITYLRAEVERSMAEAFLQEGDLEQAEQAANRAIALAVAQESGSDEGIGLRVLGAVQYAQGRLREAEETLVRSVALLREHGPRFELAQTDRTLASLLLDDPTQRKQASSLLDEAEAIFTEAGAQEALKAIAALQ